MAASRLCVVAVDDGAQQSVNGLALDERFASGRFTVGLYALYALGALGVGHAERLT
jgi:hypothetical protein